MGYIYKITNKINKHSYVGQTTKDLYKRWDDHFKKRSNCRYLSNALLKHGKDAFEFKLICICFDEDLNVYEKEYIKKFNTIVPNGYNIREGGNSEKQHEETKKRISEKLKTMYKDGLITHKNGCLGKRLTREHKEKISNGVKGRTKSEQCKQKLREVNLKYKVLQYSLDGQLINTYQGCVAAAASVQGINKSQISAACKGKNKTAKGFIWKYEPLHLQEPF